MRSKELSFNLRQKCFIDSEYEKDFKIGNKKFNKSIDIKSNKNQLRPEMELDHLNELIIFPDKYLAECTSIRSFTESLDHLKQQLGPINSKNKILRTNEYPRIVFLGTGSAMPTKFRNNSAILVHTT